MDNYFVALRTLEEFGPDSNKNSTTTTTTSDDNSSKRTTEDEYNEGLQEEQVVTNANNLSQSASKVSFNVAVITFPSNSLY